MIKSFGNNKIKDWDQLESNELEIIIDYLKHVIKFKKIPLHSTYQNLIYALIFYGQKTDKVEKERDINANLGYCEDWKNKYSDYLLLLVLERIIINIYF